MVRMALLAVVVAVATASLVGCSSTRENGAVAAIAHRFVAALQAGQGSLACELLTGSAQNAASGATDVPCAQAVLKVEEGGDTVHGVQVWGDAAQVAVGSDTIFLHKQKAGWAVRAAGCRRQNDGVYNCKVDG